MRGVMQISLSVLILGLAMATKADENHKAIGIALAMHKSRTLSPDESDTIARFYMHELTHGNNYPVIVFYEGEGNNCALDQFDIKIDVFARKDRFKTQEVYSLTTIIFNKADLLHSLALLNLSDDQLKILTADKSHQVSADNIVLWATGTRAQIEGIVKQDAEYVAETLLPTITPTMSVQPSK